MRLSDPRIRRVGVHGVILVLFGLLIVWNQPAFSQDFSGPEAAIKSKDYDRAITQLRTILQKKPKSHEGHYLLGMALKGKGQINEALAEFQESVQRKKKYTNALYELGLLQIETEQYDAAAMTLAEGIKYSKEKEPRFFYAQGLLQVALGDDTEAKNLMSKAQAMDPDNELYVRGLGDVYRAMKVWAMAIRYYKQALAMDPNSPNAAHTHYMLGKLQFDSRDFDASVEEYKKAVTLDPTIADAWFQQGYILHLAKQWVRAEEPLRRSLELKPDNFEANFCLAEALNHTRRIKMAVPYYQKALALDPDHKKAVECYPGLASGLVALGEYDKAVNAYNVAIAQDPENFDLVYALAWTQSQAEIGDYDNAVINLKKAIQLDPSSEKPHIQIAIVYFDLEKYADAVPHLEKAIGLNPKDPNPYAYLGRAYFKQQMYDEGVNAVRQKLDPVLANQEDEKLKDKLSNVYYNLGRELYSEKHYLPAIAMYQQKVAYDTTSYATYVNLGIACLVGKEYELARDTFLKAVALKASDPDPTATLQVKKYLAGVYLQMNDNRNARALYKEILQLDPNEDSAYYRLAVMRARDKQFGLAIPHLKKAIQLKPDNLNYHLLLAQAYLNSQQFAPAVKEYQAVLKLDPKNKTAKDQINIAIDALNKTKKKK